MFSSGSLGEEMKKQDVPESGRILSAVPDSPGGSENMQANGIPDDRQSVSSTDNLVGHITVQRFQWKAEWVGQTKMH